MHSGGIAKTLEFIFGEPVEFTGDFTYDSVNITSGQTKPRFSHFMKIYDKLVPLYELRIERNQKLAETDWTQTNDIHLENEEEWVAYRQGLRDLPSLETPIWPEPPQVKIVQGKNTRTQLEKDLQTTRTQLEKDLQTTRTQLEKDLQTTDTNLQTTRTELSETKADLQTTRTELIKTKTELEKILNTHTHSDLSEIQTINTKLKEQNQKHEAVEYAIRVELFETKEDLRNSKTEFEITKLKLHNTEARLEFIEQTLTSILSKLSI
jgi:hypothetical protein